MAAVVWSAASMQEEIGCEIVVWHEIGMRCLSLAYENEILYTYTIGAHH